MKRKVSAVMAACLAATAIVPLTACASADDPLGEKEIGERTQISFLCANNALSAPAWKELVAAYNDGVGYDTDKVFVNADFGGSAVAKHFTKSVDEAYNVVMVDDPQKSSGTFVELASSSGKRAPNGYMLDLTSYAEADADFQNAGLPKQTMDWWRFTRVEGAKEGAGEKKHIIGAGQNIVGVPIASNPHFNWYNEALFKAQGINIVSIPESELDAYNTANSASIKPHGYAEYKTAPKTGLTMSKNLAGETVCKVFNNCIGMNWEEQRNILKYFTSSYNDGSKTGTKATTSFGFVSEYWFNYGWSVGGDVIGFNGTEYDFTLLDTSKNYIVTKDGTKVNNVEYSAGEIVRYEDRVNQANIASIDGLYAIESQYNAVKEYVSLQVAKDKVVDNRGGVEYKGYGVADPDTGKASTWFNNGELAMTRGNELEASKMSNPDVNICPAETYREYEGGSVYYDGGTGYANEYLKVIGETYDGVVYTGDIKKVNGTPIIGNTTTASISKALVIPACSDPEKYQAAWNFISYVATEGQKYIAKTTTVPLSEKVLFGDDYVKNAEISKGKNLYAVAQASLSSGRGDWGYFKDGEWVNNWSNTFNDYVRRGTKTLTEFENEKAAIAKTAVNNMTSIIKGIR